MVRTQVCVVRLIVDFVAEGVEGRNAGVAAARDIDRGKIERKPKQVVAQRAGDELVDLVADLVGCALRNAAGAVLGKSSGLVNAWISPSWVKTGLPCASTIGVPSGFTS